MCGRRHPGERAGGRPSLLITGAAGVVGTVLARDLARDHRLIALDPQPVREPDLWDDVIAGSVGDRELVLRSVGGVDAAIHLAHGAYGGWEGLREVEIDGTRNVLDGALGGCCRRVIVASSNHVNGWDELDHVAGLPGELPVRPTSAPRPDGLYGAAKVAAEALARAAAEYAGLPVSVLRIGTVRLDDDPDRAAAEPGFGYLGDAAAVRRRLARTWLHHRDLVAIVRSELSATETFRSRYATSSATHGVWSDEVATWQAPR